MPDPQMSYDLNQSRKVSKLMNCKPQRDESSELVSEIRLLRKEIAELKARLPHSSIILTGEDVSKFMALIAKEAK